MPRSEWWDTATRPASFRHALEQGNFKVGVVPTGLGELEHMVWKIVRTPGEL